MNNEIMLQIDQLHKTFNGIPVIENLSLRLMQGERMALFAPSGAGKTTLMRILAGLETPDSGTVAMMGEKPVVLFQEPRLFPFLTVEENIFLPFKAMKQEINTNIKMRYQRWLEVCELTSCGNYYPYQLSGGMKQKTAVIRAMLPRPHFVLMDEPFQSIGFEAKREIITFLLDDNPKLSCLFITHLPDEIPQMAQSVLVFQQQCLCQGVEMPAEAFTNIEMNFPNPVRVHTVEKGTFKFDF
jgi:ABC-type nitrate/sulfonate/bicarbonate transport system ATPase subunit